MNIELKKVVSQKEMSAKLGISPATLYKLIDESFLVKPKKAKNGQNYWSEIDAAKAVENYTKHKEKVKLESEARKKANAEKAREARRLNKEDIREDEFKLPKCFIFASQSLNLVVRRG